MDLAQVIPFWFGELDADGLADSAHAQSWWQKDAAFDAEIRQRFLGLWQALMREAERAPESPEDTLAKVIVLDQFSRNMFREKPEAFSSDARALAQARALSDRGEDRALAGHKRVFLYMPFMHSERLADQDRCLALLTQFRDEAHDRLRAELEGNIKFAARHRDIIVRFARFPHRNQVLGRVSTLEETAFLTQPGSSF